MLKSRGQSELAQRAAFRTPPRRHRHVAEGIAWCGPLRCMVTRAKVARAAAQTLRTASQSHRGDANQPSRQYTNVHPPAHPLDQTNEPRAARLNGACRVSCCAVPLCVARHAASRDAERAMRSAPRVPSAEVSGAQPVKHCQRGRARHALADCHAGDGSVERAPLGAEVRRAQEGACVDEPPRPDEAAARALQP